MSKPARAFHQKSAPTRDYHRSQLQSSIMMHTDLAKLVTDERAIDSMARSRGFAPAVVLGMVQAEIERRAAL